MPARLVVFDLDGTLVRGRTVCEVLADALGQHDRMVALEAVHERDAIVAARAEMASWYQDVSRGQLLRHLEHAELAPLAVEGIELLRRSGVVCGIASITWSFAADWFAERLGIPHALGTRLDPTGRIGHVWPDDKRTWVTSLGHELGIAREHIATVGDSWRDVHMFDAGAHAMFVGNEGRGLPDHVTVAPGADILSVARWALDR